MDHPPVFVVAPEGSRWRCRQEGGGPSSDHGSRADAVDQARELARSAGCGRVRIEDASGRAEQQWTFHARRRLDH